MTASAAQGATRVWADLCLSKFRPAGIPRAGYLYTAALACTPQACIVTLVCNWASGERRFARVVRAVGQVGFSRETGHLGRFRAEVRFAQRGAIVDVFVAQACACEWPRGFQRAQVEAQGGVGSQTGPR